MPIFRFLAVTGAILVALLFVADATLAPRGPLFTNESVGLPRSEPMRPKQAELPPEPVRPRAPALVPMAPEQSAAVSPAPAVAPVAVAAEALAAVPQIKPEPARAEPVRIEAAETAAAAPAVAPIETAKAETATTETRKAASPKPRKQARKHERGSRYAAYRESQTAPAAENGHAYGVPLRRERPEWQRQWGGEFGGQNRFRF